MTGTWHKTACNLCYVNCGIEVLVNEGHVEKVRGDRSSPKSQGYLCNKAARIPYYAHHKDRLTMPLRRRADGGFDAIEWDVAIAEIAPPEQTLVDRHGGKSMALSGGGGQGNHAGGAYANAFLRALGSRNVFNALSQEKTGDFWINGHMFGSRPATPPNFTPLRSSLCNRCKSVDCARFPQRPRPSQSDPQGPGTQAHCGRSAPVGDRRDGRPTPCGSPRRRCVSVGRAIGDAGPFRCHRS